MAVNRLAQSVLLYDGRSARGTRPDNDATTGRKATAGDKRRSRMVSRKFILVCDWGLQPPHAYGVRNVDNKS